MTTTSGPDAPSHAPFTAGDRIRLRRQDGSVDEAVVSVVVATGAPDPSRRWRLLCRWADDGSVIDAPVYAGDDADLHITGELELESVARRAAEQA